MTIGPAVLVSPLAAPPGCPDSPGGFWDDMTGCLIDTGATVVSPVADVGLTALAKGATAAFGVMMDLATKWIVDDTSAGTETITRYMEGATKGLVPVLATMGLMVAGTRLVLASSRAQESAWAIFRGLAILALVTAGGAVVANAIQGAFDSTAATVIVQAQANAGDIGQRISNATNEATPVLTFLIALLGCLVGMVQYVVMLFRSPVMALMEGMLPIAAAAAMTGAGMQWLKRLASWIMSFAIYKYLAAVIIAAALEAVARSKDDNMTLLTALALFTISALALPAMIRLITPFADAVGTGGGGALLSAVGAAAMGAMMLGGRGRSAAGGSGAAAAAAQGAAGLQLPAETASGTALPGVSRTPLPGGSARAIGSGSGRPSGGPSGPPPGPSQSPGQGPGPGRALPSGTGGRGTAPTPTAAAPSGSSSAPSFGQASGTGVRLVGGAYTVMAPPQADPPPTQEGGPDGAVTGP